MNRNNDMMNQPMDGRQFSWNVLAEMGMTPGDMRDIMLDISRNGDLGLMAAQGMGLKGASTSGHRTEEKHHGHGAGYADEMKHRNEEFFEKKQEQQERWQAQKDLDQKVFEEKQAQQDHAANRPAEDAHTMRIGTLPLAFVGGLIGLELMEDAVNATGNILSPHGDALGGTPTMIASNNGGSLTSQAQNILGAPQNNLLVTGPNQTQSPTLGQPAPTLQQSGVTPPSIAPIPGMNGPSGAG
ncbi:MAG: hypothetical protein CO093_07285 [Alphaproteobacteria bacterium CG_4_9_14_3_um_filter_47_13]|nr:MAG: hypothetical protein CO093_07285 [Alphaproteobacteria bacterium CG_4_9_14_3_um_filter_47_13]